MTTKTYHFRQVDACNMCGSSASESVILGRRMDTSHGMRPQRKVGIATTVVRCTQCGLIYANPRPIPVSIHDHYGVPAEDYWKPEYFAVDPDYFQHEIATAKELLDFDDGMTALDIGAGIGKCMVALSTAGFRTQGIEPGTEFRNKALSEMKIDPGSLQLSTIEEAQLPSNHFDFVTFGAVLEHLDDPAAAIQRAVEWARPGGVVHAEVPYARWTISRIVSAYRWATGANYSAHLSPMHPPYHLYEFTVPSFQRLADRLNISVARVEHNVCSVYYLPRAFHALARWYMERNQSGMQLTVWLRKPGG